MKGLALFFKKDRSFSLIEICGLIVNFIVTYAYTAGGLYLATRLSLGENEQYTQQRWLMTVAGGAVIVAFTYIREIIVTKSQHQKLKDSKLIYDLIGSAIEELIQFQACGVGESSQFIGKVLRYIERATEVLLKNEGIATGQLCANLMVVRENAAHLDLEYFGTFWPGRSKRRLKIDPENPMPGAPEAYVFRETAYVDDTTSERYRRYFSGLKPYRSIISMPVPSGGNPVFAVVNLDSSTPDQFISVDFINKTLIPIVSPFLGLLRLEKCAIMNSGSDDDKQESAVVSSMEVRSNGAS